MTELEEMNLLEIDKTNIDRLLKEHNNEGGNEINKSLKKKLFNNFPDESNKNEVSIKVAALNQIYSTAIRYIKPIVEKIVSEVPRNHLKMDCDAYIKLVDDISTIEWVSETTEKKHKKNNLSFSSKYVHFLNKMSTPIYDSHIWLIMAAYLREKNIKVNLSPPKSYSEFYKCFINFKRLYKLESYSNYKLDKFLWQYGKNILTSIMKSENVNLDKAKAILKKRITRQ